MICELSSVPARGGDRMNRPGYSRLHGRIGLVGVVTLGAGTAIGVSIFSVLQPAAQLAGSGLLIGILIAGLPMVLFATVYAYLGSALPISGASYDWPRLFIHPFAGFVVTWLRIVANVGALVVLSLVLVRYLSSAIVLPLKATMGVAITTVFALNYFGVRIAAGAQTLLMGILLALLAAFVIQGAPHVATNNIGPLFERGTWAIATSVPLLASLFLGIESAADVGEEIRNAHRNLPLGIGLAIALTAIVYGTVAFVALGLVGPQRLANSDAPLLEAARVPFGSWAVPLIVSAAVIAILKTMNSAALTFSRSLFAMGRSGVLPSALARIHPRFQTPHIAVLTGYCAAMFGLLLPSTVMFLLLAVNIPTMLKYLACSLSAVRVAGHYPQIHARSRLRLAPGTVRILGYSAAVCALAIGVVGTGADWRPYALVGAWLLVGLVYWVWRRPPDSGPTIEDTLLPQESP
jgi:APA family basic amino acid/polyamine antiporter